MGIDWWATCMTKGEWSGWMQAIFSVLAILGAITIAWWQHHKAARHIRLRDLAVGSVAADTVTLNVAVAVGLLEAYLPKWEQSLADLGRLTMCDERADELQAVNMPTDEQLNLIANVWPDDARMFAISRSQMTELISDLRLYRKASYEKRATPQDAELIIMESRSLKDRLRNASDGVVSEKAFL